VVGLVLGLGSSLGLGLATNVGIVYRPYIVSVLRNVLVIDDMIKVSTDYSMFTSLRLMLIFSKFSGSIFWTDITNIRDTCSMVVSICYVAGY